MIEFQAATDMELAVGSQLEAAREREMPLGVIVYVVLGGAAQALWFGLIGWWLVLTLGRSRDAFQARYARKTKPGAHATTQPITNPRTKLITPQGISSLGQNRGTGWVIVAHCEGRTAAFRSRSPRHHLPSSEHHTPCARTCATRPSTRRVPAAPAQDWRRPRCGRGSSIPSTSAATARPTSPHWRALRLRRDSRASTATAASTSGAFTR
jgi:hypothetical protein